MGYKNIEAKPSIYKWAFAIGTTSRVPSSDYLHYLILDIDTHDVQELMETLNQLPCEWYEFKTEHGYHFYTDLRATLHDCTLFAKELGADPKWVQLAQRRGYFFLADKDRVILPWPVERMVIWRRKESTQPQ